MGWLHALTGFQLFVIASLYDFELSLCELKYKTTKTPKAVVIRMVTASFGSLFFTVYWFIVAAWPVIAS